MLYNNSYLSSSALCTNFLAGEPNIDAISDHRSCGPTEILQPYRVKTSSPSRAYANCHLSNFSDYIENYYVRCDLTKANLVRLPWKRKGD